MTSAAAPSTFASLLRKSKFSTFDPHIGQVYTAPAAHAFRGDWGLKRPLTVRTKRAHITVKNIDTRFQQTEWQGASAEAKFVKKVKEMGASVDAAESGPWRDTLGSLGGVGAWGGGDSDFASRVPMDAKRPAVERIGQRTDMPDEQDVQRYLDRWPTAIPNVHAMRGRHLERYLNSVRGLRDEYLEYSGPEGRKRAIAEGDNAWDPTHFKFLAYQLRQRQNQVSDMDSISTKRASGPRINKMPHPNGGLSYAHAPELQAFVTSSPVPGRLIRAEADSRGSVDLAAVGGHIGDVQKSETGGLHYTDLGHPTGRLREPDSKAGEGVFRATGVGVVSAPSVVGAPGEGAKRIAHNGLADALVKVNYRSCNPDYDDRPNKHQPGSRGYVACKEKKEDVARGIMGASKRRKAGTEADEGRGREARRTTKMLKTLRHMVSTSDEMKLGDDVEGEFSDNPKTPSS